MCHRSHHVLVPSVKIISMPEAPFVPCNVSNFALLVSKPWFPHQGAVSKNPRGGLFPDNVLRFHCKAFWLCFKNGTRSLISTSRCSPVFPLLFLLFYTFQCICCHFYKVFWASGGVSPKKKKNSFVLSGCAETRAFVVQSASEPHGVCDQWDQRRGGSSHQLNQSG